jgi:hypothetical protein
MKLKLTADGKAEVKDGLPVYVHDDGKEIGFDAPGAMGKISSLQGENKSHRERAEAAETKLKAFDGIKDAAAAVKALETVANLDAGQLVKAGEVEEIKKAAVKASEEKIAALSKTHADELGARDTRFNKLQTNFHKAVIGNVIASSQFVKDKLAVPRALPRRSSRRTSGSRIVVKLLASIPRGTRSSAGLVRARLRTSTRRWR